MNVQKIFQEGVPEEVVGLAISKMSHLEFRRRQAGAALLKDALVYGGYTILLSCGELIKKIIILGGGGQLLFAASDDDTTFTVYNYLVDALSGAGRSGRADGATLHPTYNGTCHLGEVTAIKSQPGFRIATIEQGANLIPLGSSLLYEMEFLTDQQKVYARTAEAFGAIAKPLLGHTLLSPHCHPYRSLFGLATAPLASNWNLWQGLTLSYVSPANAATDESWVWIPSFFTMHPGEGVPPGWYYGHKGYSQYDQFTPLTSAKVSLLAVMETKDTTIEAQTGWVEMVTEVNGAPDTGIFAYFTETVLAGNGYSYNELVTGDYNKSVITIGSDLAGFSPAIKLGASVAGVKPEKVVFWNVKCFVNEGALTPQSPDGCALLVIEGTRCRGVRYHGYQETFIDTSRYHSHAVSSTGQFVAIFEFAEASPGVIANVKVFDLYGERATLLVAEEDATYLLGGFSLLRDSAKPATLQAQSGCFIPYRKKGFTPLETSVLLGSFDPVQPNPDLPANVRDTFPALATMRFIKDANSGLTITKLFCENGVDAELVTSTNECFGSVIPVDDPDVVTNTDKLVASWDEGPAFKGKVRGSFVKGEGGLITFNGVSEGALSGWYGVLQLQPTFGIAVDQYGEVFIGDHAGEITYGSCLDENGDLDLDNCSSVDCDTYSHQVTATSSCGQTGSGTYPADPLTIAAGNFNTDGTVKVGSTFTAIGGVGNTFSFSLPSLSFTVSGRVATVTAIGSCGTAGTPAWRTATVSDACVTSDGYDYRLPNGRWGTSILIFSCTYPGGGVPSDQTPPLCRCSTGVICRGIKISGGMRTSESFRWLSAAGLAAGKASPYNCQLPSPIADTFTDSCGTATSPSASAYCDDGCANPIKAYVFNRSIQEWIC